MPSFDVVSEFDLQELTNAVDQANREITTRFDLKGVGAKFEQTKQDVLVCAPEEFQVKQLVDILISKIINRGIDPKCMEYGSSEKNVAEAKQKIEFKQGLDKELAKKVVKLIKDSKMKVQASIQGDKVRITGKKRDDLQEAIALLKEAKLDMPLQYNNFRD